MRVRAVPVLLAVGLFAGCGEAPPPEPIPTTGPNQVVFYVPTMT